MAINNNGQVTGYSSITATIPSGGCYPSGKHTPCTTHPTHAFLWSNGTMTDPVSALISVSESLAPGIR